MRRPSMSLFKRSSQEAECSDRYADEKRRRGPWTPEEDQDLLSVVGELRASDSVDWSKATISTRTSKQCHHRYRLRFDPTVKRGPWTAEEDELLLKLHDAHGRVWVKISTFIEGRPEWSCKSRFHSLRRLRMKEWSVEEDDLIRSFIASGRTSAELRERHMPERTIHAVQKRWDLIYIRDLGKQIRSDIQNERSGRDETSPTKSALGKRRSVEQPKSNSSDFSVSNSISTNFDRASTASTAPTTPLSPSTTSTATVRAPFGEPLDLKHASWASGKSSPSKHASKRRSIESAVFQDELFVVAEEEDQHDEFAILGPSNEFTELFGELTAVPTKTAVATNSDAADSPTRAPRLKKHASSMTMMLQVLNEECL